VAPKIYAAGPGENRFGEKIHGLITSINYRQYFRVSSGVRVHAVAAEKVQAPTNLEYV
jgi:hypothetical protein